MSESTAPTTPTTPTTPPTGASGRPSHSPLPHGARPAATPIRRQFVSFAFYKLLPEFRRLPQEQQRTMLNQFADLVEANNREKMILLTYSCIGTRADVDIMFWKISFHL